MLKKPLKKVWPQRDKQQTNTLKIIVGLENEEIKNRDSCLPKFIKIKVPTWINRQLLKKACIIIWKKDKVGEEIPKQKIKKPIWESVLKAIIFLKSGSHKEQKPATKEVKSPPRRRNKRK